MFKLFNVRNVEVFGMALILVTVLATAAYLGKVSAPQPPNPVPNVLTGKIAPVSISANPEAARSVYMSEQTLRRSLDDAYERHQAARVQTLLRILNGRYEYRCCGLPR